MYSWRRKWQPSPVFLPGESHGHRSLVGYSPWGRKESDMTEHIALTYIYARLPRWHSGKESAYQSRRYKKCRFSLWVGKIPWRRKWQPTLVFLPGESQGNRSLVDYSPWGCKESNMTEWLGLHTCTYISQFHLSTNLSKGTRATSAFWLLSIMLQWILMHKYLLMSLLLVLSNIHLEVGFWVTCNSTFSLLWNCQTAFHSGSSILHFYQ